MVTVPTFNLFLLSPLSNSNDWSLTIPSSDSRDSVLAGLAAVSAVQPAPLPGTAVRPRWASCSSASTGSSSASSGGSGKGGVRVGLGQDQDVPAKLLFKKDGK